MSRKQRTGRKVSVLTAQTQSISPWGSTLMWSASCPKSQRSLSFQRAASWDNSRSITAPQCPLFHPLRGSVLIQIRSEEHTSELQSQSNLVCRLLLEKKKEYER